MRILVVVPAYNESDSIGRVIGRLTDWAKGSDLSLDYVIVNDGCCPIHASITKEQLIKEKEKHPAAPILIHPECEPELLEISDVIGSTAELIDYVSQSPHDAFIVCTEDGVDYKLVTDNPEKKFFYPDPRPCCTDMKLNTLENILLALEKENHEVLVNETVAAKAQKSLDRMLELGR